MKRKSCLLVVVALLFGSQAIDAPELLAQTEETAPEPTPQVVETPEESSDPVAAAPSALIMAEGTIVEEEKGEEEEKKSEEEKEGEESEVVVEEVVEAAPSVVEVTHDETPAAEVRTIAKKSEQLLNSLVVISGEELVRENISDVGSALLLIPGAAPEFGGTGGVTRVSIDGLAPGRVTVMRDGVPIGRVTGHQRGSAPDFGQHALDPESIERMEITRGIGPNGSNGIVVNLISKKKDIFRSSLTARYGHSEKGSYRREVMAGIEVPFTLFFDSNSHEPNILKELNLGLDVGYRNDAALKYDQKEKFKRPSNPALENIYGDLRFGWSRGADYLVANFGFDSNSSSWVGEPDIETNDVTHIQDYRVGVQGRWNHDFGIINHSTSVKYFNLDYDKYLWKTKKNEPKSQTYSTLVNQTIDATFLLGDHDLTVSGTAEGEWLKREGDYGHVSSDKGLGFFSLGVGDRWYINKEWDIEAQLRGIAFAPKNFNFDGTLRVAYKPTEHYLVRLVGARSVQRLTAEQVYIDYSNNPKARVIIKPGDDLKPEVLHTIKGEFGARYQWIAMTVSPFFNYIDNYIMTSPTKLTPPPPIYSIQNATSVMTAGLNIIGELNLPYGINIAGNYTYLPLAKLGNSKQKDKRVNLRPEHSYHAEINGNWLDNTLGARIWVDGRGKLPIKVGPRIGALETTEYADAMADLSLGLHYQPWKWLKVGVEAHNLLNQVDRTWGPQVGRYYMGTVTLRREGWF